MSETTATTEIDQVRAQFLPLMELDEDAYHQAGPAFVQARREALEATAQSDAHIVIGGGNFQGYLGPDAVIDPAIRGKGYRLDDQSVYDHVSPLMRTIYRDILPKVGGDERRAYINAAYRTAQHAQQLYFGSVAGSLGGQILVLADILDEPDLVSIADFKTSAICSQRTAVANNVLQILGVNPVFEIGTIQVEGEPEPADHAYLLVPDSTGGAMLYDPTNPHVMYDEHGGLLSTDPAIYPIGDVVSARNTGTPIAGQHKTWRPVDGQQKMTTQALSFSLNPKDAELYPS